MGAVGLDECALQAWPATGCPYHPPARLPGWLAAAQKPCLLLGGMCCSIVHHKRSFPYGSIYTHHFAVLEAAAGPSSLRLAWLSEGFR